MIIHCYASLFIIIHDYSLLCIIIHYHSLLFSLFLCTLYYVSWNSVLWAPICFSAWLPPMLQSAGRSNRQLLHLKKSYHFLWQNQPLTFKPGTVCQFVSLMRLLFFWCVICEARPAMLSCWPIFAPSWILLTHCHTRGFWIHCPSELPWYETCRKHSVCVGIRILCIKICLNHFIPIPSMHAISTYIWLNFMVNVG